jgi:serine protease Do
MSTRNNGIRRLALSAYAALLCAAASSQSLSPAMFLPIAASVVRVEVERQQGGLSVGSGVTVAPSVVATSCHVMRDAIGIRIAGSGAMWNVDAQYADLRRDVCFLRAPSWRGQPVQLADGNALRPGSPVAALGFTGGAAIMPRFGHILALHSFDAGQIIESNASFNSGSSGGGLFDAGGALLGLLTFRLRNSEVGYYSVPVEWIRASLPDDSQWTPVQPLRESTAFWQREADDLPYFMRAKALEAQGSWPRVLELAEHWAAANPREAEPMLVRAWALHELHQSQAAVAAFNDASELTPDDPSVWYGLALATANAGDGEASRRAGARLEALDDGLARALAAKLGGLEGS